MGVQLVLSPCGVSFLLKPHQLTAQGRAMGGLRDGKRMQQNWKQRWSRASHFLLRTGKGLHVDGDRCH